MCWMSEGGGLVWCELVSAGVVDGSASNVLYAVVLS
jgi:hypothetical protein